MKAMMVLSMITMPVIFGGCADYHIKRQDVTIDPSYNRVILYNDSAYAIELSGAINTWLLPGQRAEANIPCYGRFKGMADAYRVLGKGPDGDTVYERYGQRSYHFHIDGKNRVYRQKSSDDTVVFRDGSFSPQTKGWEYIVAPDVHPCGLGPSIGVEISGG